MKVIRLLLTAFVWTMMASETLAYDSANVLCNGGFEKGDQKHLPEYLKGKRFNDPYFVERWQKYLEAFLPRYGDYIDYLNIGNEVNNYFGKHYSEWANYLEFFRQGALDSGISLQSSCFFVSML